MEVDWAGTIDGDCHDAVPVSVLEEKPPRPSLGLVGASFCVCSSIWMLPILIDDDILLVALNMPVLGAYRMFKSDFTRTTLKLKKHCDTERRGISGAKDS